MNGEPFCYGWRLTVRQLLELRRHGYDLTRILTDHPELQAARRRRRPTRTRRPIRDRYAEFFGADGSLAGPGFTRGRGGDPAASTCGSPASSSTGPRPT